MATSTIIREGDRVIYVPNHAHEDRTHKDCERGKVFRLSSDGQTAFVKFDADIARLASENVTAKGCYLVNLVLE